MNWKRVISATVGVAATAAASAVNPALGTVVGASLIGGAGTKAAGVKVEKMTGMAVHKTMAPVAAVGSAAVAGQFVDPAALCAAIQKVCAHPASIGLFMVGAHQLWSGLLKAGKR